MRTTIFVIFAVLSLDPFAKAEKSDSGTMRSDGSYVSPSTMSDPDVNKWINYGELAPTREEQQIDSSMKDSDNDKTFDQFDIDDDNDGVSDEFEDY